MKEILSIPNASRTFEALRSLGYDLNSSIADVVDNSITEKVGAKNISIRLEQGKDKKVLCAILDDGCGMSATELEEAMRIGTQTEYKEGDLGKFGMGMKTASLSHCNVLTVISKKNGSNITGFQWDISHINSTGKWHLLMLNTNEIDGILNKHKINFPSRGTLVLWSDVFWIDQQLKSFTSDKLAANYFFRLVEDLKLHLGMVFHRFLDGSLGKQDTIQIKINNELVSSWDPFCRSEKNTQKINLKKELSCLKIAGTKSPVIIEGYILPNKEGFSSEQAWKEAKGLLSWNDSQGYYIYRANRIIRFGGWHGTKAKDEHDKLARISIDIDSSLDKLFRITVNKTKIQFPEILYYHLKNAVNPFIVGKAQTQYRKSKDSLKVNNTFRRSHEEINRVSKELLDENKIKTKSSSSSNVEVENPSGTWLSNKMHDFLRYGSSKDFEILSDNFEKDKLWKIVCSKGDKFKVIINSAHPFYKRMYGVGNNKAVTAALDAFIFSLAFAELYNKNNANAHLFETFKTVTSQALEKLINEEII